MQNLAIALDEKFGKGTLTRSVQKRLMETRGNIVIFDGVRWQSDVKMIRSFPNNVLVYVTADLKIRYNRAKKRNEKAGESTLSFEDFKKEELAATEICIGEIGKSADFTIVNNNNADEFDNLREQVRIFYRDFCHR